jgi:hypothetical protein
MQIQTRLRALALLGLISVTVASSVSCSLGSDRVLLTITTVEDTVQLVRNSEAAVFHVSAIMRNRDTRRVGGSDCGPSAQREIDGAWVTVYTPYCLGGSSGWALLPGDSLVMPVTVYGYTLPNTGPPLDPRMVSGRYRLLFGVSAAGQGGLMSGSTPVDRAASTPFFVKEGS